MADINKVTLIGRLTRDSELRYTEGGTPVSKFSVAVNRSVKRGDTWEDEVSFFDVVLWGKMAVSVNQYLLKGKQVGIDGELRQERWEQNGQYRSRVEIVANKVQLLGGGNADAPQRQQPSKSPPQGERGHEGKTPDPDHFTDDIPF
jgi:single-strand DNA-binding protein